MALPLARRWTIFDDRPAQEIEVFAASGLNPLVHRRQDLQLGLMGRPSRLGIPRNGLLMVAGIGALIVAGDTLYATATTEGRLSVVAVLSSLYPIVTIALARTVLDEQMTPRHGVGAGLALTGAAAVSTA